MDSVKRPKEAILGLCGSLHREVGSRNLCLAGGVALNCVANGRILREGLFEQLWIQPAAGDAGSALGVALAVTHGVGGLRRNPAAGDGMKGTYLGPAFDEEATRTVLEEHQAVYQHLPDEELFPEVAR